MHTISPGFEHSLKTLQAVKDYGWTYPSNYLDIYFDKISVEDNIAKMDVNENCLSSDGLISMPALGVFVDVSLSNAARAMLGQKASLATVALRLGIVNRPGAGQLRAISKIAAGIDTSQIGATFTQVEVFAQNGTIVAVGSALMGLAPFKNALDVEELPSKARDFHSLEQCLPLKEKHPEVYEAANLARQQATDSDRSFIDHFWGSNPIQNNSGSITWRFKRGEHLANRSGNVHGGLLYGLTAQAAATVVPAGWHLAESSVQYLNAASDEYFDIYCHLLRQGRNTVVVESNIFSSGNKKVLQSQWTFLKPQNLKD